MSPLFLLRLLPILLVFTTGTAVAQSLADVLSSVQERRRAIEQSFQVSAHLPSVSGGTATVADQQLIEWTGVPSTVAFPTDSDLASLEIEGRVTLLNQAIVEFRKLSLWYLNLRPEDLANGAKIGAMRPYLREDFPALGRADAANYQSMLRELANDTLRLRVLQWPFAGKEQTKHYSVSKWEEREDDGTKSIHYGVGTQPFEGWAPTVLADGAVNAGDTGTWKFCLSSSDMEGEASYYTALTEEVTATADYRKNTYQYGTPSVDCTIEEVYASKTASYHSNAALFAQVPGRTDDQLGGKVVLLARNSWSPAAAGDVSAPPSWSAADAAFQVVAEEVDSASPVSLGAAPMISVNIGWVTCSEDFSPYDDVLKIGIPSGFGYLKAYLEGGEEEFLDWYYSWENDNYIGGNENVVVLQRKLRAMCAPDFQKGLDSGTKAAELAKSSKFLRPPSGDAPPVLHPMPGLLAGVPLGVGLEGDALGWIGFSPGDYAFHMQSPGSVYTSGIIYPNFNDDSPGIRFDYASNLRFCGPAQDFHVVYSTARDTAARGAALPGLTPSGDGFWGQFLIAWDLPRLRQVVSRDFIADITCQGHYKNTVKIYRRPLTAGAVNRTPGHLETLDEANLIRTLVFSNPGAGTAAYPEITEKIQITDGTTTHEVSQNQVGTVVFKTESGVSPNTHEFFNKTIDYIAQGTRITTKVDEHTVSTDLIPRTVGWTWWDYPPPTSLTRTSSDGETVFTNTFAASTPGSQEGRYPATTEIDYPDRPDVSFEWKPSGVIDLVTHGSWSSKTVADANELTTQSKFGESLIGTTWTDWSDGGRIVKTTSAPDGTVTSKTASAVDWQELEYGNAAGTGLPGLLHKLTRKDNTGTTWQWAINTDGSTTSTVCNGTLTNGTVTHGTQSSSTVNTRGYVTGTENLRVQNGNEVKTDGTSTPDGQFSSWGAPLETLDFATGLTSAREFDGNLSRLASCTSGLGVVSNFSGHDALGRPATVSRNGIIATNTYNAFSSSATITGSATGTLTETRDNLGRLTASNVTWNGVTDNLGITRGASSDVITRQNPLGTHTATLRKNDGTLSSASGPVLPFGGTTGTNLTVNNGLFKSTVELGDQSATYQTTWTDAWGRIRKTEAPTASGTGTTDFLYSDPDSSLKRIRVNDPTGRKTITESDPYNAAGAINRSGIDKDGNGFLGGTDRYVESITSVSGTKLVTILKLTEDSGLREILRTEWTPNGNASVTQINGGEETITRTPNYANKTVTTVSSKGWSKTESFNNLGLTTNSALSGPGIPTASLTPTWRADGSLAGISFTAGGDTHSASFNNDGTLATLNAPGRGDILGEHSFANGIETLTVDGVTVTHRLNETEQTTSGGDVPGKTQTLTASGSGFKQTTTPTVGATTEVVMNAAGAATAKNYAAGAGESRQYLVGGLVEKITLARGGDLTLGYSNDGAKDLQSATWPAVSSGPFTIPSVVQGYGHDRAGRVDEIGDASGARSIVYQNGRLKRTIWNSGPLAGYKIIRGLDDYGRDSGFELWRGNALIHSAIKAPNGVSGEVSELASGNLKVVIGRNAARQVTGFLWGNATGTFVPTVTQNWERGTAGRILSTSSNVSGAPSFNYKGTDNNEATAFDAKGRRLKCATAGGEWVYQYTNGRLTSAVHPTLGSFNYQFDGIGRRKNHSGSANWSNLLNQTEDWENTQNKTVKITAHPDARVWVNGTEIPGFTGSYNYPVPIPGASGGWVAWNTLAVLEGEGDVGANADAKAEKSGAVWIPPVSESFTYDAAGNRESSAQWDFGWNAKNELVRARTKNHNNPATPQGYDITNAFDAEGRRFSKKVIRYQNSSIVEQKIITYLHDGNDLIYEREQLPSGLTTCERKYVWGPDISGTHGGAGGAGGLLLIRETKGNSTIDLYPLYDGTGNVVALADSSGNFQAEYGYGPFGETIFARGPYAQSCPFRFATKYFDQETGLYDFGRRFLDPITGQFLSREPLGESESLNLYDYGHGDPINNVDVQGFATVAIDGNVTSSLELLSETLAKLGKPETSTILDQAMGRNADWVAYQQAVGMGGNFGKYIVGILTAHEGPVVRDVGLENRLRMWAMSATPSELTAAADSGNFDSRLTRMLHDQSQAASNAAHDWQIVSETTQGATIIAQPDYLLLKGATAGILAIKGLSMADDALRIGIRAEGLANDLRPLRVTQYFDPKMGEFPVDGRFALWSEATLGNRLLDGVVGPTTWVAPHAASDMSMWRRLMTGVGDRRNYVEFDVLPSELASPSGLKSLFGRYQQVIPGQVDLIPRNATFGTSEFNWLDSGFRYGVPSASAAGGGYLFYNSNK